MDDTFFKHMMNRGFLIFEAGSNFVLTKIPTPADPRPAITDDIVHNASTIEFDTWEKAIEKTKRLCGWEETSTIQHGWKVQMMYQHYGLGTQMMYLEDLGSVPYDVAVATANENAAAIIEKDFKKGEIEKWEVRVRPYNKSKNDTN